MDTFELSYTDIYGTHTVYVDAWDQEQAALDFFFQHKGMKVKLHSVIRVKEGVLEAC